MPRHLQRLYKNKRWFFVHTCFRRAGATPQQLLLNQRRTCLGFKNYGVLRRSGFWQRCPGLGGDGATEQLARFEEESLRFFRDEDGRFRPPAPHWCAAEDRAELRGNTRSMLKKRLRRRTEEREIRSNSHATMAFPAWKTKANLRKVRARSDFRRSNRHVRQVEKLQLYGARCYLQLLEPLAQRKLGAQTAGAAQTTRDVTEHAATERSNA